MDGGQRPHARGVRVALGTGYNPGAGIRRAWRNSRVRFCLFNCFSPLTKDDRNTDCFHFFSPESRVRPIRCDLAVAAAPPTTVSRSSSSISSSQSHWSSSQPPHSLRFEPSGRGAQGSRLCEAGLSQGHPHIARRDSAICQQLPTLRRALHHAPAACASRPRLRCTARARSAGVLSRGPVPPGRRASPLPPPRTGETGELRGREQFSEL